MLPTAGTAYDVTEHEVSNDTGGTGTPGIMKAGTPGAWGAANIQTPPGGILKLSSTIFRTQNICPLLASVAPDALVTVTVDGFTTLTIVKVPLLARVAAPPMEIVWPTIACVMPLRPV